MVLPTLMQAKDDSRESEKGSHDSMDECSRWRLEKVGLMVGNTGLFMFHSGQLVDHSCGNAHLWKW